MAICYYFDEGGLPKDLRDPANQTTFKDAVEAELRDTFNVPAADDWDHLRAVIVGMVLLDGQFNPGDPTADPSVPPPPGFIASIHSAWNELARKTEDVKGDEVHLHDIVDKVAETIQATNGDNIAYQELASVARYVIEHFETTALDHARFPKLVRVAVNRYASGLRRLESLELPPLDGIGSADVEIIPDNVRAVGMIRAAYHWELLGGFDVRDRILELNNNGLLAIKSGSTAQFLDDTFWESEDRLSPSARFMLYSRVLGVAGGDVSVEAPVNAEGQNLLLRFIATISDYFRRKQVSELIQPGGRLRSTEHIRKSGRDLFANGSLFGYGGTFRAAKRLGEDIKLCLDIFGQPEIQRIWGATNRYQVIERVKARDGQPIPNIVRHRTMAEAEKIIFDIGAQYYDVWGRSSKRPLFNEERKGKLAVGDIHPESEERLVRQIEYWSAVQGLSDQQVENLSQPEQSALAPSLPTIGSPAVQGNGNLGRLKQMVAQGQVPSMDQLKSLLELG